MPIVATSNITNTMTNKTMARADNAECSLCYELPVLLVVLDIVSHRAPSLETTHPVRSRVPEQIRPRVTELSPWA